MMELPLGGVCGAGESKKLETGKWRAFRPVVDKAMCVKCGRCAEFCPDSCMEIGPDGAEVNLYYCKGCMICMRECPVKAISKEVEVK